jgi:Mn-containing catalase
LTSDLRSNIAAEARAKIVQERLINFCDDPGTIDALQFLMTREMKKVKRPLRKGRKRNLRRQTWR